MQLKTVRYMLIKHGRKALNAAMAHNHMLVCGQVTVPRGQLIVYDLSRFNLRRALVCVYMPDSIYTQQYRLS